MVCPKCRAKVGLFRLKAVTRNNIACGISCAMCGYWKENALQLAKSTSA